MDSKKLVVAALAGIMTIASASAMAATDAPKNEKCYGIVKMGKNDCKTGMHACAGHAEKSKSKSEFIVLPEGLCAKISGGSTKAM